VALYISMTFCSTRTRIKHCRCTYFNEYFTYSWVAKVDTQMAIQGLQQFTKHWHSSACEN